MKEQGRRNEIELRGGPTIEFCGTPFMGRYELLIHNSLEDFISGTLREKIRGVEGINDFFWSSAVNESTIYGYFEQVDRVRELLGRRRDSKKVFLIQDGAFAAMVLTEMMREKGVISEDDAKDHLRGIFPFMRREDLVILTLISPKSALSKEPYPRGLEGYERVMEERAGLFTVYNQIAEGFLKSPKEDFPPVEVIKIEEDCFQGREIFTANLNLLLAYWDRLFTAFVEEP